MIQGISHRDMDYDPMLSGKPQIYNFELQLMHVSKDLAFIWWYSGHARSKRFTSVSNLLLVRLVEHVKCTRKWVSRVSSVSSLLVFLIFFVIFCFNNIFYIYLSKTFKYMIKYTMLLISNEFYKIHKNHHFFLF